MADASHLIITPECRSSRGDEGAWDEAVTRAKVQYDAIVEGWKDADQQPTLHLVLNLERPFVDRGVVSVRVCEHGVPVVQECAACVATNEGLADVR